MIKHNPLDYFTITPYLHYHIFKSAPFCVPASILNELKFLCVDIFFRRTNFGNKDLTNFVGISVRKRCVLRFFSLYFCKEKMSFISSTTHNKKVRHFFQMFLQQHLLPKSKKNKFANYFKIEALLIKICLHMFTIY